MPPYGNASDKRRFLVINPRVTSPLGVVPRVHMPAGAIAVLGEARRCGYEVRLFDAVAEALLAQTSPNGSSGMNSLPCETQELDGVLYWKTGVNLEETVRVVVDDRPDVVGITCATVADRGEVAALASVIKEALPSTPLIIGGHEASIWYKEILGESRFPIDCIPEADCVVVGPGQPVIAKTLNWLLRGDVDPPAGVAYRTSAGVRCNQIEAWKPDDFGLPAFDVLPSKRLQGRECSMDAYSWFGNPHAGNLNILVGADSPATYLPLLTSYGCGFQCSFCDTDRHLVRYSAESALTMIDEYTSIFGHPYVDLIDNNFAGGNTQSRSTAFQILRDIANRGFTVGFSNGLTFESMARNDFELIHLFADLGNVNHIAFPCENGNDRILKMVRKPHDLRLVMDVLCCVKSLLPTIIREGFFIGGFPETRGEPAEMPHEVEATLELMSDLLSGSYLDQAIFLTLSPVTRRYREIWRKTNPNAHFEHALFSRFTGIWPYAEKHLTEAHLRAQEINAHLGTTVTRRFNYKDMQPTSSCDSRSEPKNPA